MLGQDSIIALLKALGEDPTRDGLLDTPLRVLRSWNEIYGGYKQDPTDCFKTFDGESYDQMVVIGHIEFYSMCEHHMLPFYGKAHIGYLPDNKGKVIGISKPARLVDVFSRRLQIQERICEQIATTMMENLEPKGVGCIIEATHMCMRMRGVQKESSIVTTSSLKGVFLEKEIKDEFLHHIEKQSTLRL